MPSREHELLVELFRSCSDLAPELLAKLGVKLRYKHAETGTTDFSQVAPTEYRADAVIYLRDDSNAITNAVIVEVQRSIDDRKRRSWPAYVCNLHARRHCAVQLLVIAFEPSVAEWARTPIELGPPGFVLTPTVVDGHNFPRIIDTKEATKLPELSLLSAITHLDHEVFSTTISVVKRLDEDRAKLYLDVLWAAATKGNRNDLLEVHMSMTMDDVSYEEWSERRARIRAFMQPMKEVITGLVKEKIDELTADDRARIAAFGRDQFEPLVVGIERATNPAEVRQALAIVRLVHELPPPDDE